MIADSRKAARFVPFRDRLHIVVLRIVRRGAMKEHLRNGALRLFELVGRDVCHVMMETVASASGSSTSQYMGIRKVMPCFAWTKNRACIGF